MAIETLRPNANGSVNQGSTAVGDSDLYLCIDESGTNDGDSTYLNLTAGTRLNLFSFPASSIPGGSTINSVTIKWVSKGVSGGGKGGSTTAGQRGAIKNGGTSYFGSNANTSGSYAEYSFVMTTTPWGGVAFVVADLASWDAGDETTPVGANSARLTQLWIEIDYTLPIAGGKSQTIIIG